MQFSNKKFGLCILNLIERQEDVLRVIKHSMDDERFDNHAKERLDHFFEGVKNKSHHYYFYEICTSKGLSLGFAGFISRDACDSSTVPEVFIYIAPQYQHQGIATDCFEVLIPFIFKEIDCHQLHTNYHFYSYELVLTLRKFGFDNNHSHQLCLTREDRGLYELSDIIKKEARSMQRGHENLAKDMTDRSSRLWYAYFSQGIMLSTGGVDESIVNMPDLVDNPHLQSFNMYRNDWDADLSQEAMKKFFIEEKFISSHVDIDKLSIAFCLGSHEGFMRVARCIYRQNINDGVFFPFGSYGLLSVALYDMKPLNYKIHHVDIDRNNAEKIDLSKLNALLEKFPTSKTLFIDLKTTVGAVYTKDEMQKVISFCKQHGLFLIADAAHANMEFNEVDAMPDITELCQRLDYHEYIVMYTGSKTYGLERARVGFILFDQRNRLLTLEQMQEDFWRVFGTCGELPLAVASQLMKTPLLRRQQYLTTCTKKHRFNMNLMLAYIEGIQSPNIAQDLVNSIKLEIEPSYQKGIKGIRIVYIPKCGIQMKVDTSELQNKYFANIRMYNAEIFSYALNKIAGVVSLHSLQIMDPLEFGMRLSFSIKNDVHRGMKSIHHFVSLLSDKPSYNKFMPGIRLVEEFIFTRAKGTPKIVTTVPRDSIFYSNNSNNLIFRNPNAIANESLVAKSIVPSAKL